MRGQAANPEPSISMLRADGQPLKKMADSTPNTLINLWHAQTIMLPRRLLHVQMQLKSTVHKLTRSLPQIPWQDILLGILLHGNTMVIITSYVSEPHSVATMDTVHTCDTDYRAIAATPTFSTNWGPTWPELALIICCWDSR